MNGPRNKATFMVSLDFELYWGTRDLESLRDCRRRTANMQSVVASLLKTFREHEVHATWATVGFLFSRNREELLETLPPVKPDYASAVLSPYRDLDSIGTDEQVEPACYAVSAIREIERTPFQEVGTHTFSHYYCLEDGQTAAAFESDLAAARKAAARRNIQLRSIVFPRNQVNAGYLPYCQAQGIICYRGAGSSWMYTTRKRSDETFLRRASRIANAYVKISGHHSVPMETIMQQGAPFDFPGTTHLRPPLMMEEPWRSCALRRIYQGLDYAARNGHLYHLWFHPEDFAGPLLNKKIEVLSRVFEHYSKLRAGQQIESLNMGELAEKMLREQSHSPAPAKG